LTLRFLCIGYAKHKNAKEKFMEKAVNGKFVSVNYKGTLKNGEIFDTTEGCQPMELHMGSGKVIQGFEDAILGMALNDKKVFTIDPENAYGHRIEDYVQTIPRKEVPPDMDLEKGDFIEIQTPDGRQIPAQITQLDDEKVVLDLNHPLAGMALTFEVEVVGISDTPTQEEDDCCSSGCECSSGCH
jgi:peptidylprolyl isomerase